MSETGTVEPAAGQAPVQEGQGAGHAEKTHAAQGHAEKTHMIQGIIFGLIFVALVTAVFGFLMGSYVTVWPIAAVFAIWTIVSLVIFRGGAEDEH